MTGVDRRSFKKILATEIDEITIPSNYNGLAHDI